MGIDRSIANNVSLQLGYRVVYRASDFAIRFEREPVEINSSVGAHI